MVASERITIGKRSSMGEDVEPVFEGMSDAALLDRVRRGSQDAFTILVNRYQEKLKRILLRNVGDVEISEDLAQETFLRIYHKLDQFDSSRRFGPWLFRIGVNIAIDWLRRNKFQVVFSALENECLRDPDTTQLEISDPDPRPRIDLQEEVQTILNRIPRNYREVMRLQDLEGHSTSEVARIIKRKEPTVRWRLSKGREEFREMWNARDAEPSDERGDSAFEAR